MNTSASPPRELQRGIEGAALVVVGALWLAVAGMIAIVIRMQVPTPAELLRDVAGQRALWIASNVALILQQAFLATAAPRVARSAGPTATAVRGLFGIAGAALVASGAVHGVFGAHLASKVTSAPLGEALVLDAELSHAIADTFWFVGVSGLVVSTALVTLAWRPSSRLLAWVGAGAVVFNLLQFGWFFDHVFGVFAGPGTLLQAVWFGILGRLILRGD